MAAQTNSQNAARDTIYAVSSGALPAAIAIVRVSGPQAGAILVGMTGEYPPVRAATLRSLRGLDGEMLDRALVLWMPGPATATGEDIAELHLHGGRAVVSAVMADLAARDLRHAEPGEFTRRALFNERMDLTEVEGLADLLAAETESQRREALRRADGVLSRQLDAWSSALLDIAARIEARIDYDGEEELSGPDHEVREAIPALVASLEAALAVPPAERLRDGLRVVISGPPNAGKSTLFNALVGRDAAIVSPIAGTTRDAIERPVAIGGLPFVLIDTAGLRKAEDPIERIGVERAEAARAAADIIIALDHERIEGDGIIPVSAKTDVIEPREGTLGVCALTGAGLPGLTRRIAEIGGVLLPAEGEVALDRRYREALGVILADTRAARDQTDPLLAAEHIRMARLAMDGLTGRAGIEDMLDALFGRFCLGK